MILILFLMGVVALGYALKMLGTEALDWIGGEE